MRTAVFRHVTRPPESVALFQKHRSTKNTDRRALDRAALRRGAATPRRHGGKTVTNIWTTIARTSRESEVMCARADTTCSSDARPRNERRAPRAPGRHSARAAIGRCGARPRLFCVWLERGGASGCRAGGGALWLVGGGKWAWFRTRRGMVRRARCGIVKRRVDVDAVVVCVLSALFFLVLIFVWWFRFFFCLVDLVHVL